MSGCRHVVRDPWEGSHRVTMTSQFCAICGCTTPTPDPASPCGFEGCDTETFPDNPHECWCQFDPRDFTDGMPGHHPHVPTLCTCGHVIERINPGPAASGSEGGSDHG